MPELVVKCHPGHPVMVPVVMHRGQVDPLQGHLSDLSNQIWTRPYLLVQGVVLPVAGVKVELSVLTRDLMSHGAFKGVVVNQRHSK